MFGGQWVLLQAFIADDFTVRITEVELAGHYAITLMHACTFSTQTLVSNKVLNL